MTNTNDTSNFVDFSKPNESQNIDNFQPDEEIDKNNKKNRKKRPITVLVLGALSAWGRRAFQQDWVKDFSIKSLFTSTWEILTGTTTTWTILDNTGTTNTPTKEPEKKPIKKPTKETSNTNWYDISTNNNKIYYNGKEIVWADNKTFEDLGQNYAKDKNSIFYKWWKLSNIETNKFKVIKWNWNHELSGIITTSKNLINHLKEKENREFLMTTIASVSNKNINVKDELTKASAFAMNNFKSDYKKLNNIQRWDKMTDLERAKFWVIFLYIKLMKQRETDKIRMSKAKEELKYFIANSDKILGKYQTEKEKPTSIQWDIWYDEYCIYHNWWLYWCFLNKIFITKK